MFSGKSFINAYILSFVDHFHLIHPGNGQPGALLWRTSHPVDRCRQRACPVGFDTNILACFVQTVDQRVVYPERRFSAGEDNGCSRIFADFGYDFVVRHQSALFVLRVAETAFQVTAGEADKNSRCSGMIAFPLQTIKDFVNLSHLSKKVLFGARLLFLVFGTVFLVDNDISFGLLHFYFIALRNLFANPAGNVLRCRIEWKYFIQVLMVQFLRDHFFDAGEIHHHSFGVEP